MTKELRALKASLETAKQEARTLLAQDKVTEAKEKMEEVRSLQEKINLMEEMESLEARGLGGTELNDDGNVPGKEERDLEKEYTQIVLRGIRRQKITEEQRSIIKEYEKRAVMHEGGVADISDGDTGIVVPQDIQTQINTLMREHGDLSPYVAVENVTTLSGTRVLETDADMTPFEDVEEYGEIKSTDNPKFTPIKYALKKRAGYLPITNELLEDTDENLLNYIKNWIARKATYTRNYHIINMLKTLTPKALADLKSVNNVLNVDLDPAISLTSIILTNQDGWNWFDNQEDKNGRPILQDDYTQPGRKLYKGRPIVVAPNRLLKTVDDKAPVIIGNLKQLLVVFNRKFFELASTNVGGDAWRRDTTELRAIMRDDYKLWDIGAAVYGELDLTPTP